METLVIGKPFPFKVIGIDADGADTTNLPAPPTVVVDGTAVPALADGTFTFTPTAASGNIVASCTGLPDLTDPYTASAAPAVALKVVPL